MNTIEKWRSWVTCSLAHVEPGNTWQVKHGLWKGFSLPDFGHDREPVVSGRTDIIIFSTWQADLATNYGTPQLRSSLQLQDCRGGRGTTFKGVTSQVTLSLIHARTLARRTWRSWQRPSTRPALATEDTRRDSIHYKKTLIRASRTRRVRCALLCQCRRPRFWLWWWSGCRCKAQYDRYTTYSATE